MICRMAFFRLLALNISCSRGRNIWGLAVHEDPIERSLEESQALPDPSPSSVSSAMVGGGFGRDEEACDSSFNVFKRESSFSFRTEHCKWKQKVWTVPAQLLPAVFHWHTPASWQQSYFLSLLSASKVLFCQHTFLAMTSDSSEFSVAFSYAFPTRATKSFTVSQSTLGKESRENSHAQISPLFSTWLTPSGTAESTHLAEEMTTECWSEVKILDKWAATESS